MIVFGRHGGGGPEKGRCEHDILVLDMVFAGTVVLEAESEATPGHYFVPMG